MPELIPVGIAGTGSHVPERVMTNDDFAKIVDTSDEWITQRTGIKERRFVSPGENMSDLAYAAAQKALEAAGVKPEELDLIVIGTLTADYLMPTAACQLQERLGAKNAGAFDVQSACTGFLTALNTAEAFVASGRAKCVLVVGGEALSRYLNMKDRASCILFGDGAGAAVVMPHERCGQGQILRTMLGSDGSGFEFIHIPVGGSAIPHDHPDYVKEKHYIGIRGREVFRFAVTKMTEVIMKLTDDIDRNDVSLLVPHQVTRRIIDAALERLEWSEDRCMVNIEKYGNTSAGSVPIALDEAVAEGRVHSGDLVVLVAFGAGLTWGGALLRW